MNMQTSLGDEAEFSCRSRCITCESTDLDVLSSGRFADEPLHGILSNEHFGEDPLPYLRNASWTFVQCKQCDQKFHRDVLNDDWLQVYYSRWITAEAIEAFYESRGHGGFADRFEIGRHAVERALLLEKLTRSLRGSDPVRVLDFGCGEGTFLAACASFGFEGAGIEFSEAREKNKQFSFFADLAQTQAAYPAEHFHAVTLFEVLEHLAAPLETLRALNPMVKTGGILILETPNCETVTDIQSRDDFSLISPLGHINAFTPQTQETIAKNAGFRRIKPGVVQCTADLPRVYKREARRMLQPFLKRYTQQVFVKEG